MAKLTREDFIASLKEMNLLEIKELIDGMKEEFGVDPSAVAVAAPVAAGEEKEESSTVSVVITNGGAAKVAVIKVVKENISKAEAEEIKAKLVAAGAEVEVK